MCFSADESLRAGSEQGKEGGRGATTVAPENEQLFLHAMSWVRNSRLRTGATEWGLYQDGETAHRSV
jgi:Transmembrane secretion effector